LLPNGSTVIYNRLGWTQTYLKQARLLASNRRGFFRITERGIQVIKQNPLLLDVKFLQQFPEFIDFINRSKKDDSKSKLTGTREEITPEEMMDQGFGLVQEKYMIEFSRESCSRCGFSLAILYKLINLSSIPSPSISAKSKNVLKRSGYLFLVCEDFIEYMKREYGFG
jgi:restriction system protein